MPAPDDSIAYLFSLERLGMKFGLDNMARLCEALDHPERQFASVIVAGTNGKGSVTAMLQTALTASGHHTARYTSPHLERLEERFVVDGDEVTTGELADAAARVRDVTEALLTAGVLESHPTFFECTTAVAFELFRRAGVEIAVLEVGLGGRLDATNIVTPVAAAITSIDYDHQAQLGETIESIAREKAGVIKEGIPVVCGPLPPAAAREIASTAVSRGARIIRAQDAVRTVPGGAAGTVRIETARRNLGDLAVGLAGRHQVENAAVAVALADELDALGYGIDDEALRKALTATRWPGRLERFTYRGAQVVLDAAHNPAGARALAEYLRGTGWDRVTIVFGAMRDKDVSGMLRPLAPVASRVVCTTPDTPRAMPARELAEVAAAVMTPGTHVDAVDPPAAALDAAAALGARVVAAGSIFLIGPLRGILR